MSFPSSTYEMQLLARSELLERGLPFVLSASAAPSDSYLDDGHQEEGALESQRETIMLHDAPRHVPEEELFIRPPLASSILTLPNDLRRQVTEAGLKLICQGELILLARATEDKAWRMTRLISEFLEEDTDP